MTSNSNHDLQTKRFLLLSVALLNSWIGFSYLRPLPRLGVVDLPQFYLVAKLGMAGHISEMYNRSAYPSSPAGSDRVDKDLHWNNYFNQPNEYFTRPPFVALFLLPLALLSYQAASILAVVLNLVLVAVLVWKLPVWLKSAPNSRMWLFVFMPFLYSVAMGQDTLLLTLIVACALRLIVEEKQALAGAILAFGLSKPHLIWAIPLALAAGKRWRALFAFLASAYLLALLSFALVGARGVAQWMDLLQSPTTDFAPQRMGNLRAIGLRIGWPLSALLTAVVLVSFGLVLAKSRNLSHRFAAALLAGLLLSPHTYLQDYSLVAIVALAVPHAVNRYALLIPWPYFCPSQYALPFAIVGLGTISALAVFCTWNGNQRQRTSEIPNGGRENGRAPQISASFTQFREVSG